MSMRALSTRLRSTRRRRDRLREDQSDFSAWNHADADERLARRTHTGAEPAANLPTIATAVSASRDHDLSSPNVPDIHGGTHGNEEDRHEHIREPDDAALDALTCSVGASTSPAANAPTMSAEPTCEASTASTNASTSAIVPNVCSLLVRAMSLNSRRDDHAPDREAAAARKPNATAVARTTRTSARGVAGDEIAHNGEDHEADDVIDDGRSSTIWPSTLLSSPRSEKRER